MEIVCLLADEATDIVKGLDTKTQVLQSSIPLKNKAIHELLEPLSIEHQEQDEDIEAVRNHVISAMLSLLNRP